MPLGLGHKHRITRSEVQCLSCSFVVVYLEYTIHPLGGRILPLRNRMQDICLGYSVNVSGNIQHVSSYGMNTPFRGVNIPGIRVDIVFCVKMHVQKYAKPSTSEDFHFPWVHTIACLAITSRNDAKCTSFKQ